MPRKKKNKQRKNKLILSKKEDEVLSKAPHTFVFSRGHVGANSLQLTLDMRRMMEPYTATNLKVRKKNVLKDFVAVAGALGVTNMISFSKTTNGVNMRVARLPKGPTLYFRVKKYCLCKDVVSGLKKPKTSQGQYRNSPLLVLENFKDKEVDLAAAPDVVNPNKLCATMLQNMFPSISIHKLNLNTVQRCVLFSLTDDREHIEMRHFSITVKPIGISRRMKKLVSQKDLPNLSRYQDVGDFLVHQAEGSASESEAEPDDTNSNVQLPQKMVGRGNLKNQQSAIRLTELGPRLRLELIKVEEEMCKGQVLFHKLVEKSKTDISALETAHKQKMKEKEVRRKTQEENVKKKQGLKAENKEKTLLGMKRKMEKMEPVSAQELKKKKITEEMTLSKKPKKLISKKNSLAKKQSKKLQKHSKHQRKS